MPVHLFISMRLTLIFCIDDSCSKVIPVSMFSVLPIFDCTSMETNHYIPVYVCTVRENVRVKGGGHHVTISIWSFCFSLYDSK